MQFQEFRKVSSNFHCLKEILSYHTRKVRVFRIPKTLYKLTLNLSGIIENSNEPKYNRVDNYHMQKGHLHANRQLQLKLKHDLISSIY